ncbi:glycosyltransferase family 4 protein [Desulfohalovibrio reitneri]|uniref:glycosyltransferase family 4 protein n=1 Tax=Desulfohalovibrio reitneri TaxID=1307759 RepID=UPI0004A6C95F|nr:glycosyltransferase family 4 protein [Desulfohalovibrio reitneri]
MASLLFVVSEDWYFLSHRLHIALAAKEAGHTVAVAARDTGRAGDIRAAGLDFHPLRLDRGGMNPARDLATLRQLASLFRRLRPDVVHLVALKPVLYGAAAARMAGVRRVVCAVAGMGFAFISTGAKAALMRAVMRAGYLFGVRGRTGARVILQNEEDREELVRRSMVRPEQTRLIPGSGVDTDRFAPAPEPGDPRVLCHSRMLRDKGVAELVEAGDMVRARGLEAEIVLAGEPDPANPATIPEADLRAWNDQGKAVWLGRRADIPALLAGCQIACLPSYREGLPLSLIEAAAAGRPIVATDVTGCREVVRHGVNGLLVPPRDPAALADVLADLLADTERRAAMGRESRRLAEEHFAAPIIRQAHLDLYAELLREVP